MRRCLALLLVIGAVIQSACAAGLIVIDEAHWGPPGQRPPEIMPPIWPPPRPIPPRPRPFAPLEVTRYQAEVSIKDQVAATLVEQDFLNPNDQRMEGTFLLPVPKGALLRKFTMEINGKPMEAELLAAEKARGIYEDIVRKLRDPALLEYAGQDLYKVRIFPIEPHEKKRLTFSYTQLLKSEGGLVSYTHPLGAGKYSAKPPGSVSLKVELETGKPLKSVYSPTHTVEIRRHGANRATAGYEAKDLAAPTDFQLFFAPEGGEVGVSLLTRRTGDEDGYFLLLLSPGLESRESKVVPKDVAFVLDTSGSMAGAKLEAAKKALAFCVENLNEQDRFEIIRFATDTEALFDGLKEADRTNGRKAQEFIRGLKPLGGTAIDQALQTALKLRPGEGNRPFAVIFLTDGLPTVGVTDENEILTHVRQAGPGNTRVFCFGLGHDVNTHLLDKITETTRASSTYVLPDEDLEVKLSAFYSRIKDPVLVNPVLRVTGDVRINQLYPYPLPDLFRGDQLVVAGRYRGAGKVSLALEGTAEGKNHVIEHAAQFPAESADHDFIPRLWATRRVGHLLDEIRLKGENVELRDEVADLARRYGIVTPYTAYLIVEDEARRNVPLTSQSLPQLQQDSQLRSQVSQSYAETSRSRYGVSAVSRARSEQALKQAQAPDAAVAAGAFEANRGLAPAPTAPGRTGPVGVASKPAPMMEATTAAATSRFVAGRTFYANGEQWIDSTVQKLKNPSHTTLKLGSPEYFDLLRRHPEIAAWLALGPKVQFVLGQTVYNVE